jgi:hypothetical protein
MSVPLRFLFLIVLLGGSGCGTCEAILVTISLIMSIIAVFSGKEVF